LGRSFHQYAVFDGEVGGQHQPPYSHEEDHQSGYDSKGKEFTKGGVVLHKTMERQTPGLVQITPVLSNGPHFTHPLKGLTACSQ
jgi:hypothetical protein